MKKNIFMIGNAHLDPVWVWKWQEGSAETKATIRSALDRMNEYSDFVFVCSSVFVYECIEEFDTDMFEELKMRVNEGRFVVVGGWYVQPDCNLPSGEGFARQSLYGQRYFAEKFGVTAKVGYNVDSFGHNAMLPQILKKSGMEAYVYMRPFESEMHMDWDVFNWRSPDGSTVPTFHICDSYAYNFKDMDDLKERLETVSKTGVDEMDSVMCFYGVGNHGGGPTKHNIELIREFANQEKDKNIVFGNPIDFFNSLDREKLPLYEGEFQHHASGCYSAVSEVKNGVRRCENDLIAAEIYSVLASKLLSKEYKTKLLENAWRDVLFNHFHDTFGGCCIKPAYEDMLGFLGEAQSIARRITNNALQSLSWAIDTSDTQKGLPIVVFNSHPWDVECFVTINKQVNAIYTSNGEKVTIQQVFSPAHNVYLRTDTMFRASIPACGYSTYYIREEEPVEFESQVSTGENYIENDCIRAEFDKETGYLVSLFDKTLGKELLSGQGAVPVVIDESDHDTWSHEKNYFDKKIGVFENAELKVIENGPLRATLKVTSKYNTSVLKQYFSVSANQNQLEVRAEIDWNEKNKMVKLEFPIDCKNPKSVYEIPFGYIERPCNGEEEPGQMWVAMRGDDVCLAMINDNKYSYSFKDNVMNLTVVRSPMYCDHGGERTEESDFTDIGKHTFKYSLFTFNDGDYSYVAKASRELNEQPVNILENNHKGTLADNLRGITVDADGIIVSAIKRSEDTKGIVIRAYEINGKDTEVNISGSLIRVPLNATFTKHSIKTFYLADDSNEWKEVLITEYDV